VTKARVVSLTELGSADVIKVIDKDLPPPAKGEVQIRQTAIGFNFIDVYQRSGVYPLEMPTGLGHEAAGVVELVGEGVTEFKVGDHVVYMNAGIGAYAIARNVANVREGEGAQARRRGWLLLLLLLLAAASR
jgi:NADPH2:quinone reductase